MKQQKKSHIVVALLIIGIVLVAAGYFIVADMNTTSQRSTEPTSVGYYVTAKVIDSVPANSVAIRPSDHRISNIKPIQEAIRRVAAQENNGSVRIKTNEAQFERVRDALNRTQHYQEPEILTSKAVYVQMPNKTIGVTVYRAGAG